jgi:hypothetical protein
MISILCPTRKRWESLVRMIGSAANTAIPPSSRISNIEFVLYIDNDDDTYDGLNWPNVTLVRGPRIVLSNMWNRCAAAAHGEILMQGNDDVIFRSPGWDNLVARAFEDCPDRILLVHGSDGTRAGSGTGQFGAHPFVHRRWIETLGYFTPPYFSSDYGDTWVNEIANAVGRRLYLPFIIEHMHAWVGKAATDQNTEDRLRRHDADQVQRLYYDMQCLRDIDVRKLRAAMR